MKRIHLTFLLLAGLLCLMACKPDTGTEASRQASAPCPDWEKTVRQQLPFLGHRNWIVITDMAYPLQSSPGITTLYADAPATEVLASVKQMIDQAPHVYAHIYQDEELSLLNEQLCPGIDAFRSGIQKILVSDPASLIAHEQLIARLDSVANQFQVILIKTNQTLPYTSIFMELDCKYWNAEKQAELNRLSANR